MKRSQPEGKPPPLAHEYEFITNGVKDEYLSKELTRYMNMTDEELEKEENQINANSTEA